MGSVTRKTKQPPHSVWFGVQVRLGHTNQVDEVRGERFCSFIQVVVRVFEPFLVISNMFFQISMLFC